MAIQVVARSHTGSVILRDDRDDGSFVLLVCDEYDPAAGGAVLGTPSTGDDEEWPMVAALAERTEQFAEAHDLAPAEPFVLVVKLDAMPAGPLRFDIDRFIDAVVEAVERGEETITLDLERAEDWGYLGNGEQG